MPSNMFQYNLTYKKIKIVAMGAKLDNQNRMIQAILNVHVAPIPQTKFRFNLT